MRRTMLLIAGLALLPAAFAGGDAKRTEHFGRMKEIKVQGMQERISVMQDSVSCVRAAQSPDSMRGCEERERAAMEQVQRRQKDRWDSLKPR